MITLVIAAGVESAPAETETPEPIHLSLVASDGCGEAEPFWARVTSLTTRIRHPQPAEPGRHVWIVTSREPTGGVRGALTVREVEGEQTERTLSAGACEELLEALALVVALTVDPLAGAPRPENNPPPNAAAEPPAPGMQPPVIAAPPQPAAEAPRSFALRAAVDGYALTDLAPGLTPAVGVSFEVALLSKATERLQLRVGARAAHSAVFPAEGGTATTALFAANLGVCALRVTTGPLAWMPCAGLDVGARTAEAEGVPGATSATRPALDSLGFVEVSWRALEWLEIRAQGGVRFPLLRYRYVVGPATVFEVPALGPHLGAGVAFTGF